MYACDIRACGYVGNAARVCCGVSYRPYLTLSEEYSKNTLFFLPPLTHSFPPFRQRMATEHFRTASPSTRSLIALLTDKLFSHALNLLDPKLLPLADLDDVHARFLGILTRMCALVRGSSENLLLPRSMAAGLSNAAHDGSAEAAFCMHWIALFGLQRDVLPAEDFEQRLSTASEWLLTEALSTSSLYGTYLLEFARLAESPRKCLPQAQEDLLSNVIALLGRFAELLNKALAIMCPRVLPCPWEDIARVNAAMPALIYQKVKLLDAPMAAALVDADSRRFEPPGYMCAIQLLTFLPEGSSNEALWNARRLWRRGAVAGSIYCQFYLSSYAERETDAVPPLGYLLEEHHEEKKFWATKVVPRFQLPKHGSLDHLPSVAEWIPAEIQRPPPLTRWTELRLQALVACRVSMEEMEQLAGKAHVSCRVLGESIKQHKLLAKVLERRLAEAKRGTLPLTLPRSFLSPLPTANYHLSGY
jgi:hypothetical protein